MKKLSISLLWFISIMFVPVPGSAQEGELHRVEDMVVSTSRTQLSVADSSQSISVISEQEIMASPFEKVEDILRFSAGIHNVSHYGNQTGGIQSHLTMRGTGRNRILMMLDGVPLNDNFSNSIAWVAWGIVPRESIKRIEIIRGPSSASYGSEGLGGIINIITKNPTQERETLIRGLAGSAGTYGVSGLHSKMGDRFGILLSGSYEESDGFYMVDPDDLEDYEIRRYRDVGRGFGKVVFRPDDRTDISLSGLYYDHEMGKGREFFYDELMLDQYRLGVNRSGDAVDWQGMLYLNRAEKTAIQDRRAAGVFIPDREEIFPENIVWGGELQNTIPLFGRGALATGVAYKHVFMEYEEKPMTGDRQVASSGQQQFVSPFIDLTTRFMDNRLIVNTGVRYDNVRNYDGEAMDSNPRDRSPYDDTYSSKTWDNFSPKAGLVYHADDLTTLRTSVVSGYRTPSLFELYKVHERGGGRLLRWANPELEPEKIVSWEIGAERVFFDNLWTRVTYYRSRATDYIGVRTLDTYLIGNAQYREEEFDNINTIDIQGVETEFDYYFGYGLNTFFNYTYNISKIAKDRDDPAREGNYLPGDPRHTFRAGIGYVNPHIINASILFKHDRHQYVDDLNENRAPDFTTVDLTVWRKFFDLATLRLTVENVTDEKEYIEDGRLYYGSIQISF
jgi:outer membrane receptor protein involved in Fe transport